MAEIDDDLSANTARFQAFAQRQDEDLQAPRASQSKTWLIVGVIAVVVIVVIVAGLAVG